MAADDFIFLSYSSGDRQRAEEVTEYLEARGLSVWIAPRDVRPGLEYAEQLQGAIEACRAFIVIVSAEANHSTFVRAETEMAFSLGKKIFPVRIADVVPGPGLALFLRSKHWVDLHGAGADGGLERLTRELGDDSVPVSGPVHQKDVRQPADHESRSELVRLAVQRKVPFYRQAWGRMDRNKTRLSWNWAAFFSGMFAAGVWPAYRKMWGLASIMLLVDFVITVSRPDFGLPKVEFALGFAIWVSLATFLGVFGNAIYRWHIESLLEEAQEAPHTESELVRRGGVSWTGTALFALAHAAVVALSYYGWLRPQ